MKSDCGISNQDEGSFPDDPDPMWGEWDLDTEDGRRAWLLARRAGIGSSDAPAIAGLSPWSSGLHVYLEKIGELEVAETRRMRIGRLLEPEIALGYQEATGRPCTKPKKCLMQHPLYPWMMSSLDRESLLGRDERVVELKSAARDCDDWGEAGTDQVPDGYSIQVQQQLAVTGRDVADLAVLFAWDEVRVYTIERSERIINHLLEMEADFWHKVTHRQPPAPDWEHPATLELIRGMYDVAEASEVDLGQEAMLWVQHYQSLHRAMKDAEAGKDQAKAHLLDLMGGHGVAKVQGYKLVRKRVNRKGYTAAPTSYVSFNIREPKE